MVTTIAIIILAKTLVVTAIAKLYPQYPQINSTHLGTIVEAAT